MEHNRNNPHRLRVTTLVRGLTLPADGSNGVLSLVRAAYELERRRCPHDLSVSLTKADLMAWLADQLGERIDANWGRAILGVAGLIPAGSYVLADTRLGGAMATAEGEDPRCPSVLVGGELVSPQRPVCFHSPVGMTPWAGKPPP